MVCTPSESDGRSTCGVTPMKRRCAMMLGVVLAAMVAATAPVYAQDEPEEDAAQLDFPSPGVIGDEAWLVSTSVTTTTLAVAYGVYSLRLGSRDFALLQTYLQRNAAAVHHDLHMGAGDATGDLAAMFGVEPTRVEAFGEVLYQRRQRLASLVDPSDMDEEATREFADVVLRGMAAHEELAEFSVPL